MKALIVAVLMGLSLAGCSEEEARYVNKYVVVSPPGSLYNCPQMKKWPDIKNLRELQVAQTLVTLAQNNRICASSLNAIKRYVASAQSRIEGSTPKVARR